MTLLTLLALASLDGLWFGLLVLVATKALPRLSPRTEALIWRLVPLKLVLGLCGFGLVGWSVGLGSGPAGADSGIHPAVNILVGLWVAGAVVMTLRLAAEARRVSQLRGKAEVLDNEDWRDELRQVCLDMGLRRIPELRCAPQASQPMVVGSLHPAILVPGDLVDKAGPAERRALLAHECAHIAHADLALNWLYIVGRILFYFHPALWLATAQGSVAQERASDAAAVKAGRLNRADYAAWLLKMSDRQLATSHWTLAAGGTFNRLRQRIKGLGEMRRSPLATIGAVLMAAAGLAASTSVFQGQAAPESPSQQEFIEAVPAQQAMPPEQFQQSFSRQTIEGPIQMSEQ